MTASRIAQGTIHQSGNPATAPTEYAMSAHPSTLRAQEGARQGAPEVDPVPRGQEPPLAAWRGGPPAVAITHPNSALSSASVHPATPYRQRFQHHPPGGPATSAGR
jgi:hypothetical protein